MPPNAVLDRLMSERDEARTAAIAIAESDEFNPEDRVFVDLETRATALDTQISRLVQLDEARTASDALDGRMSRQTQRREESSTTAVEVRSLGDQFIGSEIFDEYRGRGTSAVFEAVETRALPTGVVDLVAAGFKGAQPTVDLSAPRPPTPLSDVVNTVPVSGNAIEFVAWKVIAGGAAKVAEKAPKPSIEYGPTVVSDTLDTIAVYTQLTRQLIEDFGAVRQYIDGDLRYQIAKEEEAQVAAELVAATLPTATGDDLLASIRVGIATVQGAGYSPNAVVLNPADYADLDLSVMAVTVNGPVGLGTGFWGLRPIPVAGQPAGTATVGDFRMGVSKFVRSNIGLYITDSHADTFLANVFTLLAERRSLSAVVRPAALVECTATTTP